MFMHMVEGVDTIKGPAGVMCRWPNTFVHIEQIYIELSLGETVLKVFVYIFLCFKRAWSFPLKVIWFFFKWFQARKKKLLYLIKHTVIYFLCKTFSYKVTRIPLFGTSCEIISEINSWCLLTWLCSNNNPKPHQELHKQESCFILTCC